MKVQLHLQNVNGINVYFYRVELAGCKLLIGVLGP